MSLVSLIVPCHDLGRHLEDAVDSVFAQTWREFEILVVDDGSTDPETTRLLEGYDWPRTRVLTLPSHQPARARAAGLASAQGEFVATLDPRHALAPPYLARAMAAFEADEALGLVTCWLEGEGEPPRAVPVKGLLLPDLLVSCSVGPAAVARREAVTAAGGFDAAFASGHDAEWDLWIRMAERGVRGAVIPEALVRLGAHGAAGGAPLLEADGRDAALRMVEKHRDAYARHLPDVVAGKEALLREMMRRNESLVQHLDVAMASERSRLRLQSDEPRGSLARVAAGPSSTPSPSLEAALAAARAEVDSLRSSASWRLTAPLRAVHRRLMRLRGGG